MGIDAYLNKAAKAKAFKNSDTIRDGVYKFVIKKFEINEGHKGTFSVLELRVLEAQAVDLPDEEVLQPDGTKKKVPVVVKPNSVGSDCANLIDLGSESGPNNLRGLIESLNGEAVSDDEFVELTNKLRSEANPLCGYVIKGSTFRKRIQKGKNAGSMFVGVNWKALGADAGNSEAEVAQRRVELSK